MKKTILLSVFTLLVFSSNAKANDLLNLFKKQVEDKVGITSTMPTLNNLSEEQIIQGLKEALKVGTDSVVGQIGQLDGYNLDPTIKIPLPAELQQVQSLLNKFGLSAMADDVETRLNRAAEKAAPLTKDLIFKSIDQMTLEDAKAIYQGPNDSATQYFRKVASNDLRTLIDPVVEDTLKSVGAIQAYDSLIGQYKNMPFVPDVKADLINHTTTQAMEGIFHYLAVEEAAIREDPAKRTTDILKTVFSK